ncbi:MAG: hypothetical protein J0L88_03495 [Xanthomonadales bacterium]|nr:hypothetical protein [Xanthomonadales bacterium]
MPRTLTKVLALAAISMLLAWPLAANAQSPPVCGWMPEARLDELLPSGAPWRTESGGQSGSCTFAGTIAGGWLMLSVTQTLQDSPSAAARMARDLRTRMGATFPVQTLPALGTEGFAYRDESDPARIGVNLVGHHRQMVAMGFLTGPRAFADTSQGLVDFMRAALKVADQRDVIKAARQCPYVDDRIARRLLAGGKYEIQRYGEDTCVAHNGKGAILTVSRMPGQSMEATAAYRTGDCEWKLAPKLADAQLASRCTQGNARAQIHRGLGPDTLDYTFVPGHEPTAAEIDLLQELVSRLDEDD